MMKAVSVLVVALAIFLGVPSTTTRADEDENCEAGDWFPVTPAPKNNKPDPPNDCEFYQWAWQTFLYVTQPESKGSHLPRFLTYQTPEEIFAEDSTPRFSSKKKRTAVLLLAPRLAKQEFNHNLKSFMQADSNGVLVDKNGHIIYYAQHVNTPFVQFIDQNHFRDTDRIIDAAPDLAFPKGCLELKSSWKILAPGEDASKFFCIEAELAKLKPDENGVLTIIPKETFRAKVALVGLHVVGVVEGHEEFIWSTFEHVDNAPDPKETDLDDKTGAMKDTNKPVDPVNDFTFYPKGTLAKDCNKKSSLTLVSETDQTFKPQTSVYRFYPFGGETEIDGAIKSLNENVRKAIDKSAPKLKVWKNYKLTGAVWINFPTVFKEGVDFAKEDDDHPTEDPAKKILGGEHRLSNSTMETFTQATRKNCFSCHHGADDVRAGDVVFPGKRIGVSHVLKNAYLLAQSQTKEELEALERQWATAVESNDTTKIAPFLADRFLFVSPNGKVQNRAEHLDDFSSGKLKVTKAEIDENAAKIIAYHDSAVVLNRLHVEGTYAGNDISGEYIFTDNWVRVTTRWESTSRQQVKIP